MRRAHFSIRRHEHDSEHSLTSQPQSDAERRYVSALVEENARTLSSESLWFSCPGLSSKSSLKKNRREVPDLSAFKN